MSEKINSVEVFRLLSVFAVITIHAETFGTFSFDATAKSYYVNYEYLYIIINQLARFAVPFFFVISGYFWGVKIRQDASLIGISIKMSKRILLTFIAWSLIYTLPFNLLVIAEHGWLGPFKVSYWLLQPVIKHPYKLITEGTRIHLWFLIGLFYALLISSLLLYFDKKKILCIVAFLLYVIGVLGGSYSETPIGFDLKFNTLTGPFFSTLSFVSGYIISGYKPNIKWLRYGTGILIIGYTIHFTEIYVIWNFYSISPDQDYVFSTLFLGIGASLIALSNTKVFNVKLLSSYGKYTLGVYAIHPGIREILLYLRPENKYLAWEVLFPILLLLLSIMIVKALSKNKLLRKILI